MREMNQGTIKFIIGMWVAAGQDWIAWHLPRGLIAACFMRVIAYGTMGKYGTTDPNDLVVFDALERWQSYGEDKYDNDTHY